MWHSNLSCTANENVYVNMQIVQQHQKGKSFTSKNATQQLTDSVFSDRDFDKFEKEYVF